MKINTLFATQDPNRVGVLLEVVARSGFSVTTVGRVKEALALMSQRSCDLFLTSSQLIDGDGVQLVKTLRSRGQTKQLPIIAVLELAEDASTNHGPGRIPAPGFSSATGFVRTRSASGTQEAVSPMAQKVSQRLAFFQAGADECLSLSQDMAECLARIKAVLRRTQATAAEELIRMGPIDLNLTSYTLHVGGKEVPLTSKELDLLYVFLSSPNRVLSRPYLIERVWGYNYFGSPRTVDVHVRRLREKLGKAASLIHTIPCVGYKLVPPGGELQR